MHWHSKPGIVGSSPIWGALWKCYQPFNVINSGQNTVILQMYYNVPNEWKQV